MSNTNKQPPFNKGETVELDIVDLAYGGQAIAKPEGWVVFVNHAMPGDRVRATITKRKKSHGEAKLVEVVEPSPDRVDPPCPLFGECGGCSWQHLPYEMQLRHKENHARETVARLGKATPERIDPIIASPLDYRYRNKMDFTFGTNFEGETILGFHRPKQFSKILEVPKCYLAPEPVDAILTGITKWMRRENLAAWNPHEHKGLLRHLIVRHSVATNKVVGLLLTSPGDIPDPDGLVAELRELCPELQGFAWGENAGIADIARQDRERWHWGDLVLEEKLGDLTFRVSPLSFFQVNTKAAVLLYNVVRDFLGDDCDGARLLDAYCGTGTIGLYCADLVQELVGIEIVRDAIWDARLNARKNGVENTLFLAGEMRDALPLAAETGDFHRVIMDPPRGGMDKRSLRGLLKLNAPVLIYVSCNPSTLARDLVTITDAGYTATRMQPVDLFPQTFHIETVVRFDLEK